MPVFDSDTAVAMFGVPGRLTHRTTKPGQPAGLWFKQRWISEARPVKGYGSGATLRVESRFDDELGNGHNTFAITAEVRGPARRTRGSYMSEGETLAGGCLHEDIARVFPELAALIPWHLTSADGPMHYLANAVYHAGNRDYNGLRKGETRPLMTRDGQPRFKLVAVNGLGVALSDTPTGREYTGAGTVPLFILRQDWIGEALPAVPRLEWRPDCTIGEGKARDLDAARRVAVWPEATDAELSAEPAELRAMLAARLPALLARSRADIEAAGFLWAPPADEAAAS